MVDSTDINKARKQTGQAFSILGQATGAEYKRRRKEEEDYQRRMMRDKFKYGLISAAISPAVQAFGQSASDFAGDLVFGEEENFFKDTEQGRAASYRARLNKKRLAELVAAKAEIVKEGQKVGSIQEVGVSKILEARKNAIKNTEGGMEEGSDVFIDEYIYSESERKSALAEWEKQWGELNNGIATLTKAPSLAEMEAAYKKTAIGKSRGRQAFGKALSWLKGKDYENDVRKPAIERILTAGVPGQTKEWYETSLADLEENYLTASNVVEGLDAYTDNLRKINPKLGDSLKRSLDASKRNQGVKAALTNGDTETLVSKYGYTEQEAIFATGMPFSNSKTSPSLPQVRRAMVESLNADLSSLVLNSTAAQHKDAGTSFFSFDQNADSLDKLRQEVYEAEIIKATKKSPTLSYAEYQAKASKPKEIARLQNIEAVVSNFTVQLSTEAERMLLSDMAANPNKYYVPNDPLNNLDRRDQAKYEFMQLIIDTKMATEKPDIEPITARSGVFGVGAREAFVPEEILNGKITRDSLSKEVREELKAGQEEQDNPLGLTPEQIADLPVFQQSTTRIPDPLPSKATVIDSDKINSLATAVVNKDLPPQQDRPQLRASLEQAPGMLEAIKNTEGGQEFLNALYPLTDKQKRMNALGSREDRMNALGSREERMNALGSREERMNALGSREDRMNALGSREERMESLLGEIRGPEEVVEPTDREKRMSALGSREERMDAIGTGFVARTNALGSREERMGSLLEKPESEKETKSLNILEELGFDLRSLFSPSNDLKVKKIKPQSAEKTVEAVEKIETKIETLVSQKTPEKKQVDKIVSSIKGLKGNVLSSLTPEQVFIILGPRKVPYTKTVNGESVELFYEREGFPLEIKEAVIQKLYGV